jgi:hypothetical protein
VRPVAGLLPLGVAQFRLELGGQVSRVPFARFGGQQQPGIVLLCQIHVFDFY